MKKSVLRRVAAGVVFVFGLIVAAVVLARAYSRTTIRTVTPGKIYRSGQPDSSLLAEAKERGVETVINLRGRNPRERWYQNEIEATHRLGLNLQDLRFQGLDSPPRVETLNLLGLLRNPKGPVLLHCADGWDRTGWGSAVALGLHGASLQRMKSEMTPLKGHFCVPSKCFFHRFFQEYEEWLGREQKTHNAAAFGEWMSDYAPRHYRATLRLLSTPPVLVAPGEVIELPMEVWNRSHLPWRTAGIDQRIKAGARMIGPISQPLSESEAIAIFRTPNGPARDVARTELEREWMQPGDRVNTVVAVRAPSQPGLYYIHLDLVEEGVHWFSDLGEPGIALPLQVR